MKIKSITLQNYKRFVEEQTFSFCDEDGEVNEMTLLVGDNGSGKSSILQAIVALIGVECGRFNAPTDLQWEGFEYDKLSENVRIDVQIKFEKLNAIILLSTLGDYLLNKYILSNGKWKIEKDIFSGGRVITAKELTSFNTYDPGASIYWYTEQRNSFSLNNPKSNVNSIETLRNRLVKLSNIHGHINSGQIQLKDGEKDRFVEMETVYNRIFSNRKFVGAIPQADLDAPEEFWLTDGKNRYEVAEMSAGERAIFPILMDFALLNINNSIIIIDEIELHLHPPLQQALIRALPKLGTNNQFIITTHSDSITTMFKPSQIIRVKS